MAGLWLIAGPNGAGKTTCVQHPGLSDLIPKTRFINPDACTLGKCREEPGRIIQIAPDFSL